MTLSFSKQQSGWLFVKLIKMDDRTKRRKASHGVNLKASGRQQIHQLCDTIDGPLQEVMDGLLFYLGGGSKAANDNSSGCSNRSCKLHAKATTTVCQRHQTSASHSTHTGLTQSGDKTVARSSTQ